LAKANEVKDAEEAHRLLETAAMKGAITNPA